jgi:hypothetical protein
MTALAKVQAYYAAVSAVSDIPPGGLRLALKDADAISLVDELGTSAFTNSAALATAHPDFSAIHASTPPGSPAALAVWGLEYMQKRAAFWNALACEVVENVQIVEAAP